MARGVDNGNMFEAIFLIGILAICVLSAFYGADSRHDDSRHHRANL